MKSEDDGPKWYACLRDEIEHMESREMSGDRNRRGGGPAKKDARKTAAATEERGAMFRMREKRGRRRIREREDPGVGIAIKAICCIVPAIRRRQLSSTVLTSSQGLSAAWSTCALSISLSSCPVERRPRRPPCPVRNLAYGLGCVNPNANPSAVAAGRGRD